MNKWMKKAFISHLFYFMLIRCEDGVRLNLRPIEAWFAQSQVTETYTEVDRHN